MTNKQSKETKKIKRIKVKPGTWLNDDIITTICSWRNGETTPYVAKLGEKDDVILLVLNKINEIIIKLNEN